MILSNSSVLNSWTKLKSIPVCNGLLISDHHLCIRVLSLNLPDPLLSLWMGSGAEPYLAKVIQLITWGLQVPKLQDQCQFWILPTIRTLRGIHLSSVLLKKKFWSLWRFLRTCVKFWWAKSTCKKWRGNWPTSVLAFLVCHDPFPAHHPLTNPKDCRVIL